MNRPQSMQPRSQSLNKGGVSNSASPTKNFKTRVVYKNVKLDDTLHDGRSLYSQSYNKTPQTHHGQRNQGKPAESARVSLADLGAMQRMNSGKVGVNNLKPSSTAETPKTKTHFASVGGKGDLFAASNANSATLSSAKHQNHGQAQNQDKYKCGHAVSPAKSDYELHQSMYDSQALKDAMLKEFGGNPSVNINNEAEYYETVKRLDVCGRCWAAQQKYYANPFKVAYKGPGQSLYQRDFVKHPLGDQGPVIKNDFYTTGFNNEPMDSGTTMKNDYRAWPTSPVKRENGDNRAATTGIPFGGQSNYRSEFVNWGPNNALHQKMPQATTVIPELPFQGKTSYRDNFAMPSATNQLKPMNPKNTKSPITAPIPFLGESTNASTYKPFKVQQAPNFDTPEEYEPTQALPEHMRSLYAKDFGPKPVWKCPAVIFMETTTHPRLKHLNA